MQVTPATLGYPSNECDAVCDALERAQLQASKSVPSDFISELLSSSWEIDGPLEVLGHCLLILLPVL